MVDINTGFQSACYSETSCNMSVDFWQNALAVVKHISNSGNISNPVFMSTVQDLKANIR